LVKSEASKRVHPEGFSLKGCQTLFNLISLSQILPRKEKGDTRDRVPFLNVGKCGIAE